MDKSSCNNVRSQNLEGTDYSRDYLRRGLWFLLYAAVIIALLHASLKTLILLFLGRNELYSHVMLIPLVSFYLMFIQRKSIFARIHYSFAAGGATITVGLLLFLTGIVSKRVFEPNDYLSLTVFSGVIFWAGGFILIFGVCAARKAAFPLLFLIFMVPIPSGAVESIISVLQRFSAEVTNGLFAVSGVPYLRDGFTFHLPSISIEVAEQCSGIRSSLVLFIISVLSGYLFLKTGWRKVALSMAVFPITIFKNGVRIVTLSLLGAYVDESILSSTLHRRGGIPFFILAMMLFMAVLWMLVKNEMKNEARFRNGSRSRVEDSR